MKETLDSLFAIALAVLIHELGHIATMKIVGVAHRGVKSSFWGLGIDADFSKRSYMSELLVMLSGSAANLIFAFIEILPDQCTYACLAYGIYNLLPAGFLDGGEVVRLFLLVLGLEPGRVSAVCNTLTLAVTVAVWTSAVYLALRGAAAALLISAFYMIGYCFFRDNG